MLRGVLVAAALSDEVLGLDVVGLPGAAIAQSPGPSAILLGAIVQQHILRPSTAVSCLSLNELLPHLVRLTSIAQVQCSQRCSARALHMHAKGPTL